MSRKKAVGITKEEVKNIKSETEIKTDGTKTEKVAKKKSQIILATIDGTEVDPKSYFYAPEGEELLIPPYFNKMCGRPVNRDDLNDVFSKSMFLCPL